MAFDAKRGVFVLYGGLAAEGASDETWTWSGAAWTRQSPAHRPPARWGAGMASDPRAGLVVLYGGHIAAGAEEGLSGKDTWIWDGSDWKQIEDADQPGRRDGPQLVTAGDTLLLLSGHDFNTTYYGDAWSWNGSGWNPADKPPRPSGRGSPTVVWDPDATAVIVFGGTGINPSAGPGNAGLPLDDAWTLHGGAWMKLPPGPPALPYSNAIWDGKNVVVLFGLKCPGLNDAAWAWNGTRWSQTQPPPVPARWGAAEAQAADGHALVFGGSNKAGC